MTTSPRAFRGSETARALSVAVPRAGDLIITDEGNLYIGDGTSTAAAIIGLPRVISPNHFAPGTSDLTQAYQAAHDAARAQGGGTVLVAAPRATVGGLRVRSGVVLKSLIGGQRQTGHGFACAFSPPAAFTGWMVDGALEQTVTISGGASGGTYTLTGGWGGSATTAAINYPSDSVAAIQTKIRASLTGMSTATVTGTASAYTIGFGNEVGNTAINGTMVPSKLTSTSSLTGGTPVITIARLSVDGSGVHGIAFLGGITSISDPDIGAVRMRYSNKFLSDGFSANGTTLGGLMIGGGSATITNANAQNIAFSAPAQPTGAVTLYGADHLVADSELSGIVSPGVTLRDSTNFYHTALAVMSTTTIVRDTLAEFGDCDIYVGASLGRYIGARTDMAGAHGIYEVAGVYGNQFQNTLILSCGQATDNTYDGMNLNGIGHQVDGVLIDVASNADTTKRMRYGVFENDLTVDPLIFRNVKSRARGLQANTNALATDLYQSTFGRPCFDGDGGNPAFRPPARWMNGQWWLDSIAARDTWSDGTYWRDATGETVGNLLTQSLSRMSASIGWVALGGASATPTRIDGHTDFNVPWAGQAVANATSVTNSGCFITSTGAASQAPVTPGRAYTVAMHALGPANTTVAYSLKWLTGAGATISTTAVTTPVSVSTTDTLALAAVATVAPATAVTAVVNVVFARSGLTAGDVFKFARCSLIPGATATECEPT